MNNYLEDIFKINIKKNQINTIFELGSRDLIDSIKLHNFYNSKVYAFECNPDCLIVCKKNYESLNDKEKKSINLIESAVSLESGFVKFYPFDLNKYNNMGASSMYKIDFTKRNKWDPDYNRPNPQREIIVPSTRLDYFIKNAKINNIDLLCIDLQGYELNALKSLGDEIKNVKYIITETCINSTYENGSTFDELSNYLKKFNINYLCSDEYEYELPDKLISGFSEFNALFINNNVLSK
jgi:FkbM family methyltransferase